MKPTQCSRRFRGVTKGFTLTELAIVIAIMGTVLGTLWSVANLASKQKNATHADQQILAMAQAMRAIYSTHPHFMTTGNESTQLKTAGVFPADMITAAGTNNTGAAPANAAYNSPAVNAWNGATVIWENTDPVNNDSTFRISYYNVPNDACTRIASGIIGSTNSVLPTKLITACGVVAPAGTTDTVSIAAACAANPATGCKSVEFDFLLQ